MEGMLPDGMREYHSAVSGRVTLVFKTRNEFTDFSLKIDSITLDFPERDSLERAFLAKGMRLIQVRGTIDSLGRVLTFKEWPEAVTGDMTLWHPGHWLPLILPLADTSVFSQSLFLVQQPEARAEKRPASGVLLPGQLPKEGKGFIRWAQRKWEGAELPLWEGSYQWAFQDSLPGLRSLSATFSRKIPGQNILAQPSQGDTLPNTIPPPLNLQLRYSLKKIETLGEGS